MWWALDIECEAWTEYVYGHAVSEAGESRPLRTAQDLRRWYLSLPPNDIVWAHCGGWYDFLLLVGLCPDLPVVGHIAEGALVEARIAGGATLRDTYPLFPTTLREWTGAKGDLGLPCSCATPCGGYCSIRRDMPAPQRRMMEVYCEQDARALLEALRRDLDAMQAAGVDVYDAHGRPRRTLGAAAWATACRLAGLDPRRGISWGEHDAGRRAYYGGRCEVGRTEAERGHAYDLRRAYTWALRQPVPVGARRVYSGRAAGARYRSGADGVVYAEAWQELGDLALLPHRLRLSHRGRRHTGRLMWSTGAIEGWWPAHALRYAEARGVRIERIHAMHAWDRCEALWAPLADLAEKHRSERWSKWLPNALSGKLAQRPEHTILRVLGHGDAPLVGWLWHGGRVWSRRVRRVAESARPVQAAYVTSYVHQRVTDRLLAHEGRWLYCDTDSAYLLDRDDTDVGEGIGQWRDEGPITAWRALGPKIYRYLDSEGVPRVRARGVPRATWETLDALGRGVSVSREGVARVLSSGGAGLVRTVARYSVTPREGWVGMRRVMRDGTTRAAHRDRDGRYG